MNPLFPELVEITPDALSTCSRYAAARGVTLTAMISGCMVAHLLHAPAAGTTQVGTLAVTLEGVALRIRTVEELSSLLLSPGALNAALA